MIHVKSGEVSSGGSWAPKTKGWTPKLIFGDLSIACCSLSPFLFLFSLLQLLSQQSLSFFGYIHTFSSTHIRYPFYLLDIATCPCVNRTLVFLLKTEQQSSSRQLFTIVGLSTVQQHCPLSTRLLTLLT